MGATSADIAAWLLWWKMPARLPLGRMQYLANKHDIVLTVPAENALNVESIRSAIRKVYPGSCIDLVGTNKKYRRYQVSNKLNRSGVVFLECVDFVRVFNSGNVLCELRHQNEVYLTGLLNERRKYTKTAAMESVLCRYVTEAMDAIPLDGVYLIPRGKTKLLHNLRHLMADMRVPVHTYAVETKSILVPYLRRAVSSVFIGELEDLLKKALVTGRHKAGVRDKHRLKRKAQAWERILNRPLTKFRSVLAQTVVDYPEIQDEDEWIQQR